MNVAGEPVTFTYLTMLEANRERRRYGGGTIVRAARKPVDQKISA